MRWTRGPTAFTPAGRHRRDFSGVLADAGNEPVTWEPVYDHPAVRELVRIDDHFHRFELRN